MLQCWKHLLQKLQALVTVLPGKSQLVSPDFLSLLGLGPHSFILSYPLATPTANESGLPNSACLRICSFAICHEPFASKKAGAEAAFMI